VRQQPAQLASGCLPIRTQQGTFAGLANLLELAAVPCDEFAAGELEFSQRAITNADLGSRADAVFRKTGSARADRRATLKQRLRPKCGRSNQASDLPQRAT